MFFLDSLPCKWIRNGPLIPDADGSAERENRRRVGPERVRGSKRKRLAHV